MKKFKINSGIYSWSHLVIFSKDRERAAREINKFLKRTDLVGDDFLCGGKTCGNGGFFAIWMPGIPKTPLEKAILSHEIFHLASNIMRYTGSWLTDSSEESYAYLISYLTEQIYSKI